MLSSSVIVPRHKGCGEMVRVGVRGRMGDYVVGFRDPRVLCENAKVDRGLAIVFGKNKKTTMRECGDVWKYASAYSGARLSIEQIAGMGVCKGVVRVGGIGGEVEGSSMHIYSLMRYPIKDGIGVVLVGENPVERAGWIDALIIDPLEVGTLWGRGLVDELF